MRIGSCQEFPWIFNTAAGSDPFASSRPLRVTARTFVQLPVALITMGRAQGPWSLLAAFICEKWIWWSWEQLTFSYKTINDEIQDVE